MEQKAVTLPALILIIFLSTACIQQNQPTAEIAYKITTTKEYDANQCSSTGYYYKPNSFNYGIRLVLQDKQSGKTLDGYATDSGGSVSTDENYSCLEQTDSEYAVLSAYSKGYTPIAFELKTPKNQLATIEVPMTKSCTGGPSCFDNYKTMLKTTEGNQAKAEELLKEFQTRFFDTIKDNYGLNTSDYALQCMECDMGRGGYVKAKGTYTDGSNLELYYHWGWCSSGGTDCGWEICFTTENDALFQSVKNARCSLIQSYAMQDDYSEPGTRNLIKTNDSTNETRKECLNGAFEKTSGKQKTITIIQNSGRYADTVKTDNTGCLEK